MRLPVVYVLLSASAFAQPTVVVYAAAGEQASAIEPAVRSFREDLGDVNPNEPRSFPSGRREINWDAIGGRVGNDDLPGDFFATQRGLFMSTPGTRLKVSGDQGTPSFLMEDVTLEKSGLADFEAFSGQKFFAPVGSTVTEVDFRVVGGGWQQGCSNGFGAVFLDVDRAGHSYLEAHLSDGSTRKVMAPVQNVRSKGMSFAALRVIGGGCIVHVRIVSGQEPVDTKQIATPPADTVALDDFIYGEPRPLPRTSAGTPNTY